LTSRTCRRGFSKRTAAFEFPQVNGAYIQDNGAGPRKYPMLCIFWGKDCDRIASAFMAALYETGQGLLEHPLYGNVDAVPFADVERRDDLVSAANQSIVSVTFYSTIGAVYPSAKGNPRNELAAAIEGFNVAAAQQFAATTDLRSAVARANTASTIKTLLKTVSASLNAAADATSAVRQQFQNAQDAVNGGIDVLIGQPIALARQITDLIQAPGRALIGIESRLSMYAQLLLGTLDSAAASGVYDSNELSSVRLRLSNDFHTSDLFAMSAVSGSAVSVLNTTFSTKPQALAAADQLLTQFSTVVPWRDGRFGGLSQIDTGDAYQALQQVVALVAGYLIQVSFSLLPERRIKLDRDRTIIDLAAEILGSVDDDTLNFLIESNGLTGSEILELSKGRVIVYYAA
jgi:prophage DNA circulation protein